MYTTTLRRVGGSIMMAIPPVILEMLEMESDATVELAVNDGRLIVERKEKECSLQYLLAQCDPSAPLPEDDGWTSSPAVGRELI